MVSAVLFITFFVLLVLNVPISICLGLSSAAAILYSGTSLTIVATNIYSGISKFLLLAIPFFVLSGNIMAKAGISTRLIRFVDTCVGHRKGGIANVCIIVACFFGAISGSGPATVAALGAVLIPAMVERGGFSAPFSTALMATASSIAIVIPPSIAFVVYASITGVSIGDMFMAGIVPGILMGLALIVVVMLEVRKNHVVPSNVQKASAKERLDAFKDAFWGFLMPVIILGGIYGGIFTTKKFRYGKYDFAFDQMVDGITVGVATGGMRLRFLTVATDAIEKTDYRLMAESKGNEAIVVLADTPYYESLESAMKIRKYVKQRKVSQLPKNVQKIISDQQDEAGKYELSAMSELQNAIEGAQFYVDGEHLETKAGNAKSKIDQSLEYLVAHVYSKLDLITDNAGSDADIIAILTGAVTALPGMEPNRDAASAMEEYLEMQDAKKPPTSMADVQSKYSAIPYGWKEIDIAAVAAQLIYSQKVTIKYAGNTIQPDDPKLPDMLRKKSEIGKTSISKRKTISATMMRDVKAMLREYFDIMDVPDDEDGLIRFVTEKFGEQRDYYTSLDARYDGHKYPDRALVQEAIHLMDDVLSQKKDNIALIERVLKKEDALFDNKEAMSNGIENFFKTQVTVFDQAVQFEKSLHDDLDCIAENEEAHKALNTIRLIIMVQTGSKFNYNRIRELNPLMDTVRTAHDKMLEEKRVEILETVRQCMEATHTAANGDSKVSHLIEKSDRYFSQCKEKIAELKSLALLDAMFLPMCQYKDDTVSNIESVLEPPAPKPQVQPTQQGKEQATAKKKVVRLRFISST